MKKQKICIIGGGLTGLTTAISLSKLNCEVDLITDNFGKNLKSNRTIAVSSNNLNLLMKLNIFKNFEKEIWPCSIMKLYAASVDSNFLKIFEIDKENENKKIFYMMQSSKLMKSMTDRIKKIKNINIIKKDKESSINNFELIKKIKYNKHNLKYNLVILCTGHNSDLISNIFKNQIIENPYKEFAITTILNHDLQKNNTARQIFLDDEILALLPISNTKTSLVWTAKRDVSKKNDLFVKKKIQLYTKNYLRNIKFAAKIERQDLSFAIPKKYFDDRILLFGDALHKVHPFVGQGFNMILRDLSYLEKILRDKINLGLDIGSTDVLIEFSDGIKPKNFIYSVGIDVIRSCFNSRNNSFQNIRNKFIKKLNKYNFAKNIFYDIADKGIRF